MSLKLSIRMAQKCLLNVLYDGIWRREGGRVSVARTLNLKSFHPNAPAGGPWVVFLEKIIQISELSHASNLV